jgi:protein SCO1/2
VIHFASVLASVAVALVAAPSPLSNDGTELADIGPAPASNVALTDQEGKPFSLDRLRGKAVIVSFVYTTCNGTCPATTASLARVQKALKQANLWGRRVEFVSISLDPARDSPAVLASYARLYNADLSAWHFLTGEPERVAEVIAAWGMWAKFGPSGTLDHPSRIFLVDPEGRQREIYNLEFFEPETVVRDVKAVQERTK